MNSFDILRKPIITEKTTDLGNSGRYVFKVSRRATKLEIKKAVHEAFNVEVVSVNTLTVRGKPKRYGPRFVKRPSWKKAIVALAPGHSITIFEGV